MKCKDCDSCKAISFTNRNGYLIEKYYCDAVKEPFEIKNIENKCTEYDNEKENIKVIGSLILGDNLYIESTNGERISLEDIIINGINNNKNI